MSKNSKSKRRKWGDIKPPAKRTAETVEVDVEVVREVAVDIETEYIGRHRADDNTPPYTPSATVDAEPTRTYDSGPSSSYTSSDSGSSCGE